MFVKINVINCMNFDPGTYKFAVYFEKHGTIMQIIQYQL